MTDNFIRTITISLEEYNRLKLEVEDTWRKLKELDEWSKTIEKENEELFIETCELKGERLRNSKLIDELKLEIEKLKGENK